MKRLLAIFVMVLSIVSAQAQETYGVINNDTLTIYYDDLRSSREGETFDMYKSTNTPGWFNTEKEKEVVTAVIDASFSEYTAYELDYLFGGCTNLKEIEGIENINFSNVVSLRWMFYECSSLTSIDTSHFDTSKVKTTHYMFYDCKSLTSLDVSYFDTSNVTDMSCMFRGCSSLKSLDVTNFNTSKVANMMCMFCDCKSLTSLDVSYFDTSNVTDMSNMFGDCRSLKSLDVTNFNTSKVTNMSWMFYNCNGLTSIILSSFDTSNVKEMRGMFVGCHNLSTLDLSNFNTNSITNNEAMFNGCARLETLVLGKDFNKIPSNWYGCSILRKIELLSETPADVESGTFVDIIKQYARLVVPTGTEQLYRTKTEWKDFEFISEKGSGKENYTPYVAIANNTMTFYYDDLITEREGTIYLIMPKLNYTCGGCPGTYWYDDNAIKEVTKVKFEQAFSEVHPAYVGVWFNDFINLTTIEGIEYLNTDKATKMSWMFRGCGNLTSLDVSHFDTSNVTHMNSMFKGCSKLYTLDVSHFDTSKVTSMSNMFDGCRNISALDVSNFKTDKVTSMSCMFNDCINVYNLDVSKFNTSNVEDFYWMFRHCSSISSLDVSNFDTSKATNMSGMFNGCSNLKTIDITGFSTESVDPNVPYDTNTYLMFSSCGSLESIVMGDKFNIIGKYTFHNCGNLKSVTFSKNVSVIGDYAFNACQNIKTVNSSIETPFAFSSNVFKTTVYNNATLNVPSGKKPLYQSTDGWKKFKYIVEGGGGNANQDLEPIDEADNTDYGNGDINSGTDLNGNVIGNIYYNIADDNGEYSSTEGCIILRKSTSDSDMNNLEGQDIFGEDFKNGFTGIVFMVQAGSGTIKVNAQSVGSMTLKVKIGSNAPMTFELEGKMKVSIPYSVTEPTYVYIYGGETTANASELRAASSDNALKIYGIEWSSEVTSIESIHRGVETNAVIYNINGQRIESPSKGIYIKNGKKVVFK